MDNPDPDYVMVLEHLWQDGGSYVLKVVDSVSGLCSSVKYEAVTDELELKPCSHSRNILCEKTKRTSLDKNRKILMWRSTCLKGKSSRAKSGRCSSRPVTGSDCSKKSPFVDEDYQTFLDNLKVRGHMVLEWENTTIEYECTDESFSAMKSTATCEDQQSVPLQISWGLLEPSVGNGFGDILESDDDSSSFEVKLLALLSKPYSKAEHKELLNEASTRKCVQQERRTRSRVISYSTSREGRSYLDSYPDFAKELKVAEPVKALTLLRGFFFWLQNLPDEGAFKPWLTPANHLALVPATGDEVDPIQVARPEELFQNFVDVQPLIDS